MRHANRFPLLSNAQLCRSFALAGQGETMRKVLGQDGALEVYVLFVTHIPIQAIRTKNALLFWYMAYLDIEMYLLIILFEVAIHFHSI